MLVGSYHIEETKIKISNSLKGRIGRPMSNELKIKMSEYGKKRIGEKNNRWKGGKPKCIDCGKQINYGRKRCVKCYGIIQRGSGGNNWKGGRTQEYKNKRQIERRHRLGISKKYSYEFTGEYKTREHKNKRNKKWKLNNPEKVRLDNKRQKALRKNAGKLSIKTIQLVYEDNIKKYGTLTCYLCFNPIEFKKDHLEHRIPISRGGTNEYNNLAIACCNCNYKKSNKTVEEFEQKIGEAI